MYVLIYRHNWKRLVENLYQPKNRYSGFRKQTYTINTDTKWAKIDTKIFPKPNGSKRTHIFIHSSWNLENRFPPKFLKLKKSFRNHWISLKMLLYICVDYKTFVFYFTWCLDKISECITLISLFEMDLTIWTYDSQVFSNDIFARTFLKTAYKFYRSVVFILFL